jgi:hypothetical protein
MCGCAVGPPGFVLPRCAGGWQRGHTGLTMKHLHTRTLRVDAYDLEDGHVLLDGELIDTGHVTRYHHLGIPVPPGVVHHMAARLTVRWEDGVIVAAEPGMPVGAVPSCTTIVPSYAGLVGLSLARGFTRQFLERFGGPNGCTHLNTLLLEMQRTLIQARATIPHRHGLPEEPLPAEEIERYRPPNYNACHQYAENGFYTAEVRRVLRERLAAPTTMLASEAASTEAREQE